MDEAISGGIRYTGRLIGLLVLAIGLLSRLIYVWLSDSSQFPINTIKVTASYEHISRQNLEAILSSYVHTSFFVLRVERLRDELLAMAWSDKVNVERIWPDTLKITVVEKTPVAIWNNAFITAEAKVVEENRAPIETDLPRLIGPDGSEKNVLQMYQNLSKLLVAYDLKVFSLQLRDNHAWELVLSNGILVRLGKKDIETRLQRFAKAYTSVFADKVGNMLRADLRYEHGMAVKMSSK